MYRRATGPLAVSTLRHKKKGDLALAPPGQAGERRFTRMSRVMRQEWAPSILIFLLDVVTWMAIYGMASYLRNDTTPLSPAHFNLP